MVDYQDGKPSNWAKFSHSSSWDDMQEGIKGVAHKYLIQSLAADKKEPIITIKKPTMGKSGKLGKPGQPTETDKTKLAFSVQKGLRVRFHPRFGPDGKIEMMNGKPVYDEEDSKESVYITELENIFSIYFEREPKPEEIKQMASFVGVVKLVKQYKTHQQIQDIVDDFAERFFGKGAQQIVKDSGAKDLNEKLPGLLYICDKLGLDAKQYREGIIKDYYMRRP
jgi:hypothetical protein